METLMIPTKEQIQTFYGQALERALAAYAQLDTKDWEKKASDDLTAREHLAVMVSSMERETLPLTRQALSGEKGSVPGFANRSEMVGFRKAGVQELRDVTAEDLLKRVEKDFREHLSMLTTVSDADLAKPATSPAWDRPGTMRDLFFAAYLFIPGQYQDIRKVAKKKLPHWVEAGTPDQVNFHMGRIFHYMPLIFRSDKAADLKATYLFTMEGDGGGQWNLAIGDGRADAADGAPGEQDIEIKTKPQHWIDLTTGELNAITAIMPGPFQKVALSGSMGLAMKLSDLFSAEE